MLNAGRERVETATARRSSRPSTEHPTIENMLKRPPRPDGVREALQELRYLVLTEGIKSDREGHVSYNGAEMR